MPRGKKAGAVFAAHPKPHKPTSHILLDQPRSRIPLCEPLPEEPSRRILPPAMAAAPPCTAFPIAVANPRSGCRVTPCRRTPNLCEALSSGCGSPSPCTLPESRARPSRVALGSGRSRRRHPRSEAGRGPLGPPPRADRHRDGPCARRGFRRSWIEIRCHRISRPRLPHCLAGRPLASRASPTRRTLPASVRSLPCPEESPGITPAKPETFPG